MSIQYKFFLIPIKSANDTEPELNKFLRSIRIINVHREFVSQGESSFWSMAVEYLITDNDKAAEQSGKTGKSKIDYKEVLSPDDFAIFSKLREWRKKASEEEGAPVYTIFTNEQLAKMVEKKVKTKAALLEIEGIGDARVKKYADDIISIMFSSNVSEQKKIEQ
ncbi:MAG TPA: HRDC domain-containing protein [Thermodesulfovibrionia bacterium]|nr:HRDC domain-containing protein [Thermodesulfovibrionia bacterium]